MPQGYRVVSIDMNTMEASTLMARMPVDLTIGSVHAFDVGLYLGSSKSFCDYYLESTDDADLILTFDFDEADIIHGSSDPDNELLVSKATLTGIEFVDPVLDEDFGPLLRETKQRYDYAIQCDKLRNKPDGESIWLTLMRHAVRIDDHEFLAECDIDQLTEGEPFEDFAGSDPNTGCYKVEFQGVTTFFIQTRGFEFFFTKDAEIPNLFEPESVLDREVARDSQAVLLLGPNNPRANGSFGREGPPEMVSEHIERIVGDRLRYRLIKEGQILAGIEVDGYDIQQMYVRSDYQGQNVHRELAEAVIFELGDLSDPSGVLSKMNQSIKKKTDDIQMSF